MLCMPKRGEIKMVFSSVEMQVILRVLTAVVLGIALGLQRERRKLADKTPGAAGLRTHAMVCLGAALISASGAVLYPSGNAYLAASIMTGVGFIGAGSIIAAGNKIKGLANAASVWIAAAIGISVGLGLFAPAVFATAITLLVLELKRFERIE